eukprot:2651104-Rhodomonas_salina.2
MNCWFMPANHAIQKKIDEELARRLEKHEARNDVSDRASDRASRPCMVEVLPCCPLFELRNCKRKRERVRQHKSRQERADARKCVRERTREATNNLDIEGAGADLHEVGVIAHPRRHPDRVTSIKREEKSSASLESRDDQRVRKILLY